MAEQKSKLPEGVALANRVMTSGDKLRTKVNEGKIEYTHIISREYPTVADDGKVVLGKVVEKAPTVHTSVSEMAQENKGIGMCVESAKAKQTAALEAENDEDVIAGIEQGFAQKIATFNCCKRLVQLAQQKHYGKTTLVKPILAQ